MFSPGALNSKSGTVLGGVSSHAEIAGKCHTCHPSPWDADTMDDRCLACHLDVAAEMLDPESAHGRMMQIDPQAKCRTCHPEHNGRDSLLTVIEGWQFPHEVSRFSLRGHQLTAEREAFLCADCHGEDVTRFDVPTCLMCHANMDTAYMIEHHATFGGNCLECHDGVDRFGNDFDHNRFAFKLIGKHATLRCSQCHMGATTVSALQTINQDCFSCHAKDDPHQGTLGKDCASCHSPEGWTPSNFDHDRSIFHLTGAHVQVKCDACHVNGVFKGTPMDCFSCHKQDDTHMGQLGTTCERCHTTGAWLPAQFDHSSTRFILTGSHINVECKACHINGIYKNTPRDCYSCHAAKDVHKGEYGQNCGACHQTTTWSRGRFDHNTTTFPLIGNHVGVACLSCHIGGMFKGMSTNCSSCHAEKDRHNGQYGADCSICHTPTGWGNIIFDHNSSAFPLTGAHTLLTCNRCHVSVPLKISTECSSCHAEPAFHLGAFGTNCTQCHNTTAWSEGIFMGTHPVALGQNFLDHHGATCKTCHTITVSQFTCLACHETNPLSPNNDLPASTGTTETTTTPLTLEPNVFISLSPATIQVGDTSQLAVSLINIPAQSYTSAEFTCMYDPALMEVSNISIGTLFGPDEVSGIFGPQNGSFILAIAGSNGRKASDDGIAFTFNAKGLQVGTMNIECKARVSEGQNTLQAIRSISSTMTIASITPPMTVMPALVSITGQVLAGKPVTIQLHSPDNSIVATSMTDPNGNFNINIPGGTYSIVASAEGYLSAQGSVAPVNGSIVSMPVVSLAAGDVDNNGVVNQFDAFTIRMNYNNSIPAAADLNNDGVINVLDLGILAENYGKSGALPWQ